MYKKILFIDGNKSFLKTRGRIIPYKGSGSCGSGSGSNMDNYLLSLIGGIGRMSIKPKSKSKSKSKSGGALRFVR